MSRKDIFSIIAVLVLAAAWKSLFILWDVIPFNSDEAIVSLMARHILQGERPTFFYGQAYMGSLNAFLVAGGFTLLGQHIWVLRLVQVPIYLGTVLTTILIGREGFGSLRAGLLAGLLLAIPTVNVTLYTTAAQGGYGETLLLGNLMLLVAMRLVRRVLPSGSQKAAVAWSLGWGALAGLGLWVHGLTVVYSLPSGIYLLWAVWQQRKQRPEMPVVSTVAAVVGFLIGALPWWLYAATHGLSGLLTDLMGAAVAVEQGSWLVRTGMHLVNFLLLGISVIFGFRPPWNVRWLVMPLLPFVLIFWTLALIFLWRHLRKDNPDRPQYALLTGVMAVLLAGFLFTSFGVDPSGRYFISLAAPLALVAAQMILRVSRRAWQTAALLVLVVGYQALGSILSGLANPPGLTTQYYEPTVIDHRADVDLIAFLRERGETRGYANYWTAYPLAFQSAEDLIFLPYLPYHLDLRYTPRDNRYKPYTALVENSERVAYITTRNPALDNHLRAEFTRMRITWQEAQIGDYRVYFALSEVVRPSQIGLGMLRQ